MAMFQDYFYVYVMWHHLITTKYPLKWAWVFLDPFFCQECNQASNRQQHRCGGLVYPFKCVIVVSQTRNLSYIQTPTPLQKPKQCINSPLEANPGSCNFLCFTVVVSCSNVMSVGRFPNMCSRKPQNVWDCIAKHLKKKNSWELSGDQCSQGKSALIWSWHGEVCQMDSLSPFPSSVPRKCPSLVFITHQSNCAETEHENPTGLMDC